MTGRVTNYLSLGVTIGHICTIISENYENQPPTLHHKSATILNLTTRNAIKHK